MDEFELRVQESAAYCFHLRKKEYRYNLNPLAGMCYIASEALFHLSPGYYKVKNLKHEGVQHWWLVEKGTGRVVDLTASQFETPVPYDKGVGRGFLTKQPSKRAQVIIDHVRRAA